MCFAILGVLICHCQFLTGLSHVFSLGSQGVEIFFFLSGMGLVLSWQRDSDISHFYRKRMLRILPSYYICIAFLSLIGLMGGHTNPLMYESLFVIGPWTWFLAFLFVFYLIFPLYMKLSGYIAPSLLFILIVIGTGIVMTTVYFTIPESALPHFDMKCGRIPSFFLGCLFAQRPDISNKRTVWIVISAIALLFLFLAFHTYEEILKKTGIIWMVRTMMTPGCCYILAALCALMTRLGLRKLLQLTAFIGTLTLEIYILEDYFRCEMRSYCAPVWHMLGWIPTVLSAWGVNLLAQKVRSFVDRLFPPQSLHS